MPGGRPTKYNAQFHPKLAEAWANSGLSEAQIAERLGVAFGTLKTWEAKHPEFLEAIKTGKGDPDDRVENALFKKATGYTHKAVKIFMQAGSREPIVVPYMEYFPPDTGAAVFWLKNRRQDKWRDTREYTLADSNPLNVIFKKDGDLEESNLETNVSS